MIPVVGYAAKQAKGPLTSYTFKRRDPLDHDIVIDIQYCGICHSDIHRVKDEWADQHFRLFQDMRLQVLSLRLAQKQVVTK
jgi:alcohol dehydrogenase (NADP+)